MENACQGGASRYEPSRRAATALLFALIVGACGAGESFEVDPEVLPGMNPYVYGGDDEDSPADDRDYLLYVPGEYLENPGEAWPLVLYLHGIPTKDLEFLAAMSVPRAVQARPYRFIMAAPHALPADHYRPGWAWFHSAGYLKGFLDHVASQVNVDPERIYVTGESGGATGAWALASAYPELPAALVTVAGGWNDRCLMCEDPENWTEQVPANVCEMKDIPTWVFHGDSDRVVPWQESQAMVDALRACGSDVRFTLQEGVGHNLPAFDDPALYEWMLAQGFDGNWSILPSK